MLPRSTITPNKTCSADLYRHIKRRVGHSIKRAHCQRFLVSARKQAAYKLSGTKGSLSSLNRVLRPLFGQDSTCSNRQHYSGVVHKQGGRHEIGRTLCPTLVNFDLVYQETSNSQGPTHSRLPECGSRQAIQVRPDNPDRVVSAPRGLPSNMQQGARGSRSCLCLYHQYRILWPLQWTHSICHGRIWMLTPSHQHPYWAKWWRSCRTPHVGE